MALFDKLRFWRRADGGGTATTTHSTRSAVSYAMPLADASSHYAVYAAWSLQYRASLSVNLQLQQMVDGVWETAENHPAISLWEFGNVEASASEMLSLLWWGLDQDGIAILHILRDGATRTPTGWEVLRNNSVEIRAHPDGVGIQYRLIPERGARIDITDSVIPIRWCLPLPTGQTSPIRAILDQLYLGAAATRFAATRVTDPPNVNWVLSPNISEKTQFTAPNQQQLAELAKNIREASYSLNGDKILALGLPVRIDNLESPLSDETLISLKMQAEYAVAAVLGIDPDDLQLQAGLTDSHSYASVVEARQKTWQDGLMPMLNLIAQRLTAMWLPEFVPITPANRGQYRLVWDYSGVPALAADLQLNSDVFSQAYRDGAMSVEEYRERIRLPADLPEGTYYNTRQPLEFTDVGDDDGADSDVA